MLRTAHEMLTEAAEAARRVGTDANLRGTAFGPVNAKMHHVNVAVTLGDAGTAIDLARQINLAAIAVTERKASLLIDVARAFFQWGRYEQAYAALRGLTVTADLGTAPALGDPRLAEQLAANLADNAIRYNVTGGRVDITAGRRGSQAFLTVTNTGPVIPPDQLSRLFQPFQRLDPGPRVQPGLGLGLAIISAIAAAHGAELRAVTRAAGGLAVEVIFPPPPAEAGRRAQGRAEAMA